MGGDLGGNCSLFRMRSGGFRPVSYINGMADEEQKPSDCRHPQQAPGNVNRNLLTPRTLRPFYEVQAATFPPAPRIARFTRFIINGTLKPLCCRGLAPRTA